MMIFFKIFLVLISLGAVGSIVWYTIKTGISPMPSSQKAFRAMYAAIENSGYGTIVDAGSGWGTLVIALAKRYPQRKIIGYELSSFPWLVSLLRKHIHGLDNLSLYRKDYLTIDHFEASIILCYLYPGGMKQLEEKLGRDKHNIKVVISNTFAFPSLDYDKVEYLNDLYKSPVYVYRL